MKIDFPTEAAFLPSVEGLIVTRPFRESSGEIVGWLTARPNAEPPTVTVNFIVPTEKEPYMIECAFPNDALIHVTADWHAGSLVMEAMGVEQVSR